MSSFVDDPQFGFSDYMIRLRLFFWARMPQKWCVSTILIRTLSFTHKEITFRMMSHLTLDLTHLFPARALYLDSRLTVHGSELGPSQRDSVWAPGVPYAPAGSLSTLPWQPCPSLFSLLDFCLLPFQENLGGDDCPLPGPQALPPCCRCSKKHN